MTFGLERIPVKPVFCTHCLHFKGRNGSGIVCGLHGNLRYQPAIRNDCPGGFTEK